MYTKRPSSGRFRAFGGWFATPLAGYARDVAKKDKKKGEDPVIDLAARIGTRAFEPTPPPPPAAPVLDLPPRLDGPLPPRRETRPATIGGDEPARALLRPAAPPPDATAEEEPKDPAIPSPRTAPGPGEMDLVVTPLPTPDDWHRFELALRRLPGLGHGVGQVKTEYYRHGVLKMRVSYAGQDRLANILRAGVPGYRVRVIGEDRTTIQILVSSEGDERRPG